VGRQAATRQPILENTNNDSQRQNRVPNDERECIEPVVDRSRITCVGLFCIPRRQPRDAKAHTMQRPSTIAPNSPAVLTTARWARAIAVLCSPTMGIGPLHQRPSNPAAHATATTWGPLAAEPDGARGRSSRARPRRCALLVKSPRNVEYTRTCRPFRTTPVPKRCAREMDKPVRHDKDQDHLAGVWLDPYEFGTR